MRDMNEKTIHTDILRVLLKKFWWQEIQMFQKLHISQTHRVFPSIYVL